MTTKEKVMTSLSLVSIAGSAPERINGRSEVARSEVKITLSSDQALNTCLATLEASDQRLAEKPQKYDWQNVWVEKEEGKPGGNVIFGVAWYDEEFYKSKRDVYLNTDHTGLFKSFGVQAQDITVRHFELAA